MIDIDGSEAPVIGPYTIKQNSDMIFPPADMRGVIEKTAQFVAKNGVEFEQRVLRDQNNQKFAFLFPSNPYHAFYRSKVNEYSTGEEAPKPTVPQAIVDMRRREEEEKTKKQQLLMLTQISEKDVKDEALKVEPPPADVYTVEQPYIASIDVDMIQITAQFVARNGQKFLAGLAQREKQNPQFEFLKPTHPLFTYFTNLVDAYTKCMIPPKEQLEKLQVLSSSTQSCIDRILRRFVWDKAQEKERKDKEDKSAEERLAMQSLEWHEFHIVETIDFTMEEEGGVLAVPIDFKVTDKPAPKPMLVDDLDTLGSGIDTIASLLEEPEIDEDINEEKRRESDAEPAVSQLAIPAAPVVPSEVVHKPIMVIKGYVRQRKRTTTGADVSQGMQKCPITGQLIPAAEMSNHLRILLLDPKWKEQKDRFLEKARAETAFATMEDIEGNLAQFVAKRPDLFGSVEEQVAVEDVVARDPEGAKASASSALSGGSERLLKKQKTSVEESNGDVSSVSHDNVEVTIVCIGGDGLEAQEIQIEASASMTVDELKGSLLEAGLGSGNLLPSNFLLRHLNTDVVMENDRTLKEYGVEPGVKLELSVIV